MKHVKWPRLMCAIGALLAVALSASPTAAQGVTTAAVTGVVKDDQGGVIPGATVTAVHQPSGTTYESVSQADGRFFIPGMRVGGPYKVTATLSGFTTEVKDNVSLQPRRRAGSAVHAEGRVDCRDHHGRRHERSRVQLGKDRRRHSRHARRARDPADHFRPHHRHHAADAAVRRQRLDRRPGQPRQQHDGGRARTSTTRSASASPPAGSATAPASRRSPRGDRAGAGQRRAVRRAPGQFHRRRHQYRHPQRQQQVHRFGLPPSAQRVVRRH